MFSKKKKFQSALKIFFHMFSKVLLKYVENVFQKNFQKKGMIIKRYMFSKNTFVTSKKLFSKKKKTFSLLVLTGTELGFEVEGGKYNFSWAYFLFFF